ncbi:MAG: alanine racemase [Nitrospirae bacterium]|nr:MAG: alanine racemase [Nitrospirota bacterium]
MNPTVAEIHLPSLRHNLQEVTRRVGTAAVLAIVKADAYGHGAVPVSQVLLSAGAHQLGVATVEEGLELRGAGITAPILVMGGVYDIPAMQRSTLTPVLPSRDAVETAARLADPRTLPLPVHLKVDTGMGRLGITPEEALALLRSGWPPTLRLEGVMSHLASADEPDREKTEQQLVRFRAFLEAIRAAGLKVPTAHIANSAAILKYPSSLFDLVRPGLMLYGYASGPTPSSDLRPALAWKTRVVQIKHVEKGQPVSYGGTFVAPRPSTLAVLPVGYADGYSRAFSNKGRVLIGGRPAPVVGRVCMDLTMVDVTDHPAIRPGDEAVLLGRQGSAAITADDLAAWQNTISYEILCQIGPRTTRVYLED